MRTSQAEMNHVQNAVELTRKNLSVAGAGDRSESSKSAIAGIGVLRRSTMVDNSINRGVVAN